MIVRQNAKNKTNFVYNKVQNVEAFISTPLAGAKKATRLTIRNGNTRLDLNGAQARALRKVLDVAYSE